MGAIFSNKTDRKTMIRTPTMLETIFNKESARLMDTNGPWGVDVDFNLSARKTLVLLFDLSL